MKNEHKDDIWIGEGRWIKFIDLHGRYDKALDIDRYFWDIDYLWDSLETFCVAGCCGIDAFDFSPEAIQKANASANLTSVLPILEATRSQLVISESDVFVSTRLN